MNIGDVLFVIFVGLSVGIFVYLGITAAVRQEEARRKNNCDNHKE